MKHMRLMFCVTIVLMTLLAACAPASTPTPVIIVNTATIVPRDGYIGSTRRNINHSTS